MAACPRCGASSIPIVYGEPAPWTVEEAERGELAIGGCLIAIGEDGKPTNPGRKCTACGHEFGEMEDE